jgi:heme exporter protein CcmB
MKNLIARELRLSLRHAADTAAALLFFVIAATLFPFALGPGPQMLAAIAPGIVWTGCSAPISRMARSIFCCSRACRPMVSPSPKPPRTG